MIVSHTHKFIFIKTLKTAGSSIEAFLSQYCEGRDIVTYLKPEEDELRRTLGVYPLNNLVPKYDIPDEKDAAIQTGEEIRAFRTLHKYHMFSPNFQRRRIYFGPHAKAKEVRAKVGSICWSEYYVFSFDRNPWERAISFFYFSPSNSKVEYATDEQVHTYLTNGRRKYNCNSKVYLSSGGKLMVDELFDYAKLDEAMQSICKRFGFDFDKFKALPRFKGDHRKDRRPYEEFLSDRTIDLIGEIHKPAIELLGYKPKASKL